MIFRHITCLLLLSSLLFSPLAHGQGKGYGVEVTLTSPKMVEVEPGKIVTTSFQITNTTGREEDFLESMSLPSGWQPVTPSVPIRLRSGETQVRILALSVPATFPGGRYELSYSLRSTRDYAITDSETFHVLVLPLTRLELMIEDKPQTIVAGDVAALRFRVLNRSNATTPLSVEVKGSPDYPYKVDYPELTLDAGKSQVVNIDVKTDEKVARPAKYVVTVRARIKKMAGPSPSAEHTAVIELIPRVTGDMDPYHRLPSQLSLIGVGGDGKSGFQAEFSGAGTLDEKGEKSVDFLFRTPDVQDKSIFGLRDEYRLNYRDSLLAVRLGDQTYGLSPLTEFFRYGRGAEVAVKPGALEAGAFYLGTRWERPQIREEGAYLSYRMNNVLQLKGNFLSKNAEKDFVGRDVSGQIYSLEGRIRPGDKLDLGLEYAISQGEGRGTGRDYAYRIDLKGNPSEKVSYVFEKTRAGPEYFGYYRDADYTAGAVTFPIYGNLRGNISYRHSEDGLSRDWEQIYWGRTVANSETSYKGGLAYSFLSGTRVTLDYEDFRKEDRLLPKAYDFTERAVTLGLGQTFRKLSLQGYAGVGEQRDRLSGNDRAIERYSLFASYFPTNNLTCTLYARAGDDLFSPTFERSRSLGASATWRINKKVHVNVNYQRSQIDNETKREQDNLYATATYTLPNKHAIDFKYRWYQYHGTKEKESAFYVSYSIPFGIPVAKKQGLGVLKGRVYDGQRAEKPALPKVILALNGSTAVTNSQGEFTFPGVKPGTYRLMIEKGSIGLHRATVEKLPMMVEIKEGETNFIPIAVVDACTVSGEVTAPKDHGAESDGSKKTGTLADVLVELKNGQETLREVTDRNGRFSFKGLRPGKWTVQFNGDNLPPRHFMEEEQVSLELKPGEERILIGNVLHRVPEIRMIDSGEIKTEIRLSRK